MLVVPSHASMPSIVVIKDSRMDAEDRVTAWLAQQDAGAYLVGGCIRDRLLHRPVADLDVTTAGDGLVLARRLADRFQGAYYALDRARSTGRAILPAEGMDRLVVDVARFRGDDLASDLADRDFTINALAVDVRAPDEVIDLCGGMVDLEARLIRPVGNESIRNDPLRALRAVRQAAQLDFTLAPETEMLIRRDGSALAGVAGERIRDELARLMALPEATRYLSQLDEMGLLAIVAPEVEPLRNLPQPPPHHLTVLDHSLQTIRSLEVLLPIVRAQADGQAELELSTQPGVSLLAPYAENLELHLSRVSSDSRPRMVILKLAALLHDTGKKEARTTDEKGRIRYLGHESSGAEITARTLRRLRFSGGEVRLGETIVRHHLRPLALASEKRVTSRAIYRFFRDTGEAGVDVLLHAMADHQATYAPGTGDASWQRQVVLTARMLGDYWERQSELVNPRPLIDGHILLQEFDLQPGPQIGRLLEAVREAQVSGEVSSHQDALVLVRAMLGGES